MLSLVYNPFSFLMFQTLKIRLKIRKYFNSCVFFKELDEIFVTLLPQCLTGCEVQKIISDCLLK